MPILVMDTLSVNLLMPVAFMLLAPEVWVILLILIVLNSIIDLVDGNERWNFKHIIVLCRFCCYASFLHIKIVNMHIFIKC